jgi:putative hemolysin
MRTPIQALKLLVGNNTSYSVRQARDSAELLAAQALRFAVFNLELKEGLPESYATGLDADPFDAICDHLVVEHLATSEIVGTYRLQTGRMALEHLGYYSAQEFDFAPYESMRGGMVELGRACVHQQHRNMVVLGLLWKGIADYAREHDARYLIGCSSLTSQDPAVGASVYSDLCRKYLAPAEWRTTPVPAFHCSMDSLAAEPQKVPKLLRAYLTLGAKICGPPAIDRTFKTIDFLTWVDIEEVPAVVRDRYS